MKPSHSRKRKAILTTITDAPWLRFTVNALSGPQETMKTESTKIKLG